jgi:hypothetical protein
VDFGYRRDVDAAANVTREANAKTLRCFDTGAPSYNTLSVSESGVDLDQVRDFIEKQEQ